MRFGITLLDLDGRDAWIGKCRRAEELGYDVVLVPDHLGLPAPFPALVAAAQATTSVRLGTFVLNAAFWNPTLLARDVATTDELSGGRLELGLGAGYVRAEFDAAGIDYATARDRVDHLEATLDRLEEHFADPDHRPRPHRSRVPVLLGGGGKRTLRMAVERADIVGLTGMRIDPQDGTRTLEGPSVLAEKVAAARAAAGDRAGGIEWNLMVSHVEVTDDPDVVEQRRRELAPDLDAAGFRAVPTVLVGSVEEIAATLRAARDELGLTYFAVTEPALEPFAEVIRELRRDQTPIGPPPSR